VRADLPGIDPKNVDIKVTGGFLTIKGSREETSETRNAHYFSARDALWPVRAQRPAARRNQGRRSEGYHGGVLETTATMPKEHAPQQIKIQVENTEAKKPEGGKKAARGEA